MKLEHQKLLRRIDESESTIKALAQTKEQTTNLAAKSNILQQENSALNDKISQLEQESRTQGRVIERYQAQMEKSAEHIKDLEASSSHLQEKSNTLADTIRQMEQDASAQNAWSQARLGELADQNKQLMAASDNLRTETNGLKSDVGELKQAGSSERDQIDQLHEKFNGLEGKLLQLEQSFSDRNYQSHSSQNQRAENGAASSVIPETIQNTPISRPSLPSTTAYTERQICVATDVPQAQQTSSHTVQVTKQSTPQTVSQQHQPEVSNELITKKFVNLTLTDQGNLSLEEYLEYGKKVVPEGIDVYEQQVVKVFVLGLAEKSRRSKLERILDEDGWTWKVAREVIEAMVEDTKRRKRNRRKFS